MSTTFRVIEQVLRFLTRARCLCPRQGVTQRGTECGACDVCFQEKQRRHWDTVQGLEGGPGKPRPALRCTDRASLLPWVLISPEPGGGGEEAPSTSLVLNPEGRDETGGLDLVNSGIGQLMLLMREGMHKKA